MNKIGISPEEEAPGDGRGLQHCEEESQAIRDVNQELSPSCIRQQELAEAAAAAEQRLQTANAALEALAARDGLTDLANHRTFQERLEAAFQQARRYDEPLSLLLLDVDEFKAYNDAHGHPAGDAVLKTVARLLQQQARTADLVARYDGRPCPGASSAQATACSSVIARPSAQAQAKASSPRAARMAATQRSWRARSGRGMEE